MLHIEEAIIVEGKYDKERLRRVTDAPVLCTNGFELYRNRHLLTAIRNIAQTRGIIILTDSDRAGFRIRGYLKQCLGKNANVKHVYIPEIAGKEKRKQTPGKDGLLGVEGIPEETLSRILSQVTAVRKTEGTGTEITKQHFYEDGLTGGMESVARRAQLARYFKLPVRLSANALLEILNSLYGYNAYAEAVKKLFSDK